MAIALIARGIFPDQIIFKLNNDKRTYATDCIFSNYINVNGEKRDLTLHSDKASFPKNTDLFETRGDENTVFSIIIPDEESGDNK